MEKIDPFGFYELGQAIKALDQYEGDVSPVRIVFHLLELQGSLNLLLDGKPFPLGVSRKVAERFIEAVQELANQCLTADDGNGGKRLRLPKGDEPPIEEWRLTSLRDFRSKFETVFREELREATTYFVPRRGIYSTSALVEAADETFPSEVSGFIPDKSLTDWRNAGRCLAFNLLTASGFHVARAVEGIMESYYQRFCNTQPGSTLKSWGDYISELEKVIKANTQPSPSQKTIAEFKQMKDDYRNPIAHPRVVLSEADARMLFANGESLIIAMAQELKDLASQGMQPSLALVAPGPSGNRKD